MEPIHFFSLASQHNRWLGVRQSVVAQNVANANTPGFKTLDVKAFSDTLDATALELQTTRANHLALGGSAVAEAEVDQGAFDGTTHSGNNVSLEKEFGKAGEISKSYALNTGVLKAFHRMLLLSAKG